MSDVARALLRWRWAAAGLVAVAAFAVLAGRFWHPYYGFTRFVQLDEADAQSGIHEIRDHPVFTYPGFNGYDGSSYTQIAFHPLLDSPELKPAIDNLPYRARRILGSALAWLLAGGDPARIAHTYASLNLAVWLAFAALLWRTLPVTDGRSWLAWTGVMFSAGVLHSVRFALTDLLAATLVTAALGCSERARRRGAFALLAAAGLARETVLANVVGLWRGPWRSSRAWLANGLRTLVVAVPLLAWMLYVREKAGTGAQGFGNFTWPVAGWIEKWRETFADYVRHPEYRWLTTTTLLATIALSVQAAYFLRRIRAGDAWWRAGLCGVALMAWLGSAVWEGHPGAATRVLLPMSIAFAVLAVRERAPVAWLVGGGLTVFSGVLALWHVPEAPRELAAGRMRGGAYLVQHDTGWYGVERHNGRAWAWSGGRGTLTIATTPRDRSPRQVTLAVLAINARALEIRDGATVLWRGDIGEQLTRITFTATPREDGRLHCELVSPAPPVRENNHADARSLSFAVYGATVK